MQQCIGYYTDKGRLRQNLTCSHFIISSLKRFSGIQWNLETCFQCLALLEKISFDKIFEAVTQTFAISQRVNNFGS